MPDHLIVIRSGATDYDLQGRIRGTLDIPLCDSGREEAARAAESLSASPPDAVYTSKSSCAVETGRIVAVKFGLRPRRLAGLHNLDQGLWQGMLVDDIRRKQPRLHRQWQDNPWSVAPPEGELLEDACGRLEVTIERLVRRHPSGRVALVMPQPLVSIVRWLLAGESMGDLWRHDADRPLVDVLPVAIQWKPSRQRPLQPS